MTEYDVVIQVERSIGLYPADQPRVSRAWAALPPKGVGASRGCFGPPTCAHVV